jgi:predicted PurR-regulated permease PerM
MPPELGSERRSAVELHLPVSTILKVLVTAALLWGFLRLVPELLLLILAVLLALTLAPVVAWLESKRLPRSLGVGIVTVFFLIGIASVVWFVIPVLLSQISTLVDNYRTYRTNAEHHLSSQPSFVKQLVLQALDLPSSPEVASSLKRPLAWGWIAVVGITTAVLMFALTLYLLLDGKRTYAWLLAYVPRRYRKRMGQTILEVSDVVTAYVQGQVLTSVLFGLFALGVLTLLHVPAAVPMALLAAICDVVPVLGIIIATFPAVAIAFTVSPPTALAVLFLYALYHVIENYVIIPKVYGNRLRLSSLVVLVALVVGGRLFGILGAILVLPMVAAYPIIERIWLHAYLSDEVLGDHSALENTDGAGSSIAVDQVLRGNKPVPSPTSQDPTLE